MCARRLPVQGPVQVLLDTTTWDSSSRAAADYDKLLRVVKELQTLYQQYEPHCRGVLLYPLIRKAPFIRLPNKAFVKERGTAHWPGFFHVHGRMVGEGELRHKFTPQLRRFTSSTHRAASRAGF